MTRDAQMRATDFVHLVLRNIARETDPSGLSSLPRFASLAAHAYSAPAHREQLLAEWEAGLRRLVEESAPGSDHQLTFVRHYALSARSDDAVAALRGLLDGSWAPEGLALDQDLRWTLLTGLGPRRAGRRRRDRGRAGARRHHRRPGAGCRRPGLAPDGRGQGPGVGDRDAEGDAERDLALDRAGLHAARTGRRAGAVPREVPRCRRDDVGQLGTHKASVVLEHIFPQAARLPRAARRGRRVARDDRRPRRAPSATSPRVVPTWRGRWPPRSGTRGTEAGGSLGARERSWRGAQTWRVCGWRACSASWAMPRVSPPTRSPSANAERIWHDGEVDLAVVERAAYASPVTTSITRARRVDHHQHAAVGCHRGAVEPLGEVAGVALGPADEDRELEAAGLLRGPDRLVDLVPVAVGGAHQLPLPPPVVPARGSLLELPAGRPRPAEPLVRGSALPGRSSRRGPARAGSTRRR